tara:strand:- start:7873 stop:10824 length:2952 start_codon:yes stop_codon:yes gene_type:complete
MILEARPFGRLLSLLVILGTLIVGLISTTPLSAQVVEEIVDSTKINILDRLNLLSKPPGVDSTLFRDSLSDFLPPEVLTTTPIDSFMEELIKIIPGYAVARYEGAEARFDVMGERLILIGAEGSPAQLMQRMESITAVDTITMVDSLIWTAGETVTERPGEEPVQSSNIIYDLRQGRGSAFDAQTKMTEGATWIMQGDLPGVLPDTVFGHEVNFTSCEEKKPHYHFAARELKAIGGSWLVARNVTLNFDDVPVLWLPFIFQSTETGRRSGILTPRFGVNDIVRTSRGHSRRLSNVGFFWAINDYADATVSMDWWSDNFTALTGGFRYSVNQKFLDGSVNVRRFWKANGGRELSFDTGHSWQIDERTAIRVSSSYASSSQFVRENSFDPREITQSINSSGGFNRRFDWGTLSLSANRRQFLSDDRVEMTLPTANLSLKTVTLFKAPSSRAKFYNNMTWSGSARYSRSYTDRRAQPDSVFSESLADVGRTSGAVSSSFNLGALSWSQSLNFTGSSVSGVPAAIAFPMDTSATGFVDKNKANVMWNMRFNYQKRLIGTTTLTPDLSISGTSKRSDDIPEASSSFVSGPTRISFGARLKSDIYGFYGGLAGFEAIRHKISPALTYAYAPAIVPSAIQETVFGARESRARNVITFGINQTFEAKRSVDQSEEDIDSESDIIDFLDDPFAPDSLQQARSDSLAAEAEALALRRQERDAEGGPERLPDSRVVKLLALNTSMINYDFVKAQDDNDFLRGFTTTRLQNQISSDFLRGMTVSVEHDLFSENEDGKRGFAPMLSQLNFAFAMNNKSDFIQAIGRFLGGGDKEESSDTVSALGDDTDDLNPLLDGIGDIGTTDESKVVPSSSNTDTQRQSRSSGDVGSWSANFNYSLRRNRDERLPASQLIMVGLRMRPTEKWSLTWGTSYDIDTRSFTDHRIRLTRELHRWDANFDFLQTATGNWTFRFMVSLTDNRDLKFDYKQRSRNIRNRF